MATCGDAAMSDESFKPFHHFRSVNRSQRVDDVDVGVFAKETHRAIAQTDLNPAWVKGVGCVPVVRVNDPRANEPVHEWLATARIQSELRSVKPVGIEVPGPGAVATVPPRGSPGLPTVDPRLSPTARLILQNRVGKPIKHVAEPAKVVDLEHGVLRS